ncbi:MAG: hypothetical protein PQJ44_00275, partial [Sphaerochaetaceae bacterium]|nr:hypothetical protein [Sphaerochaetaceae bacterium]
ISNVNNTDTSLSVHMYDLLPVEGRFKWATEINLGDILLQKIRVNPLIESTDSTGFRLFALQVIDLIGRATVEMVSKSFQLAPYTLSIPSELPELQDYIDSYLEEEWSD